MSKKVWLVETLIKSSLSALPSRYTSVLFFLLIFLNIFYLGCKARFSSDFSLLMEKGNNAGATSRETSAVFEKSSLKGRTVRLWFLKFAKCDNTLK